MRWPAGSAPVSLGPGDERPIASTRHTPFVTVIRWQWRHRFEPRRDLPDIADDQRPAKDKKPPDYSNIEVSLRNVRSGAQIVPRFPRHRAKRRRDRIVRLTWHRTKPERLESHSEKRDELLAHRKCAIKWVVSQRIARRDEFLILFAGDESVGRKRLRTYRSHHFVRGGLLKGAGAS
jgi:hypothetical protein